MGKGENTSIQTTKPSKKVDTLEDTSKINQPKEENEVIEDDEFEEFEDNLLSLLMFRFDRLDVTCDDVDTKEQWEDDWDTEHIDDEFSKQLRQEIEAHAANPQPMKM
ncbi:DSS1/SEM1 family protein [Cavenderia fasciculata]|uniref:DSS1/SEM1 family protein n=1 Tax=Cavenderia fasciculata TaxID=261658 RepID=F4PQZ5_CACFS|nr:DSS1/SEM1 family protein [Cavenderia fasciculata]EGG21260.1 DSS1/SEM1 family protein [Cavenderia fasciculata]|eukprot:XP_004359110.1 DSS1/SEM1 family protein [Cavenderia fasciculata]